MCTLTITAEMRYTNVRAAQTVRRLPHMPHYGYVRWEEGKLSWLAAPSNKKKRSKRCGVHSIGPLRETKNVNDTLLHF